MWLTSKQFREKYNVSPQYLYALKKRGKLKTKPYIGDQVLVWDPVSELSETERSVAIYARVSTTKQKHDLDNQVDFLKKYLIAQGINPNLIYTDIASGMNEERKGLNELIDSVLKNKISKVVISHKDRLSRFGFGYLKKIFEKYNTEIEIVNLEDEKSFQEELTEDLITIIHHFSMKFYGKRKNRCKTIEENAILLKQDEDK